MRITNLFIAKVIDWYSVRIFVLKFLWQQLKLHVHKNERAKEVNGFGKRQRELALNFSS